MNIFEALSQGKGAINEENTSSFLAYLLNPEETHGLRREFLRRFLDPIGCSECVDWNVVVNLEVSCSKNIKKANRYIDIQIDLSNEKQHKIIAIENKVVANSADLQQFKEEYNYLKENREKNCAITMVFLCPENGIKLKDEYNNLEDIEKNDNKCMISWSDVTQILKDILQDEENCQISPIMDYLKHTLKAFIFYINNTIQKRIVVKYKIYPNEEFVLFQRSDGSMRIYWENDTKENEKGGLIPQKMIEDVLNQLNVVFDSKKEITQELGRKVFNEVKKKMLSEITIDTDNPEFDITKRRKGSNEI